MMKFSFDITNSISLKKNAIFSLYLIIIVGLLGGCSSNLDSLYESYNSNFRTPTRNSAEAVPGDEDFDETLMLRDEYFVSSDSTLTLSAPFDCDWYGWTIVDMSTGMELPIVERSERTIGSNEIVLFKGLKKNDRVFSTYIPESKWQLGTTYKLTLSLKKGGLKYRDSCCLVIWKKPLYMDDETDDANDDAGKS